MDDYNVLAKTKPIVAKSLVKTRGQSHVYVLETNVTNPKAEWIEMTLTLNSKDKSMLQGMLYG